MVYCVEDDASIRELALYALTQAGIEAEGMANDVEFRAACARRLPDVVMLDIWPGNPSSHSQHARPFTRARDHGDR